MPTSSKPTTLKRFRFMFDISESTAATIYSIGNVLVVIAAIAGLLGAIGTIWGGAVGAFFTDLRIAEANAEAAKANEGLAKANLDMEDRKTENLQLSLKLEAERKDRQELTQAVAPRSIEQGQSGVALKAFRDINVIVAAPNDSDCQLVAAQLAFLFGVAEWKIVSDVAAPIPHIPNPGIVIQSGDGAGRAANELMKQLRTNSKVAVNMFPSGGTVPPNTVRVVVGPNRPAYFDVRQIREGVKDQGPAQQEQAERLIELIEARDSLEHENFVKWLWEWQQKQVPPAEPQAK